MEVTLQGYHLPGPETKARLYQDSYLTPLPQRECSTVALYVDGGLAEENSVATKCHVASVSVSATDDEPGMTSEEELEHERVPNHLVAVRSLTYQATHKKLLAHVTLDPTPEDLEAQERVRSRIAKIEKELLAGGVATVKRYRKTNGTKCLLAASRVGGVATTQEPITPGGRWALRCGWCPMWPPRPLKQLWGGGDRPMQDWVRSRQGPFMPCLCPRGASAAMGLSNGAPAGAAEPASGPARRSTGGP